MGICGGPDGSLFVADGNKILKLLPDGTATIFCGDAQHGFQNGAARESRFYFPGGLVMDSQENLYVADQYNDVIRKITKDGVSSTLAGTGAFGLDDGPTHLATFNQPYELALSPDEKTLYVTDYSNHAIRKIDLIANEVSTLPAGLAVPTGIRVTKDGSLIIAERYHGGVVRISPDGQQTLIAESPRNQSEPAKLVMDEDENIYICYTAINQIYKISADGSRVEPMAGNVLIGDDTGIGPRSRLRFPEAIALVMEGDQPVLYIGDSGNRKIKKITGLE
jgi:DNA-binding beta-propeller fold protein YncE